MTGITVFEERMSKKHVIDKSKFIDEFCCKFFDEGNEVILRPPGFGKTFNLSMLHCFLSDSIPLERTNKIFKDCWIRRQSSAWNTHRGNYPVVFLSLSECSFTNWRQMREFLESRIDELISLHIPNLDNREPTWAISNLKQDRSALSVCDLAICYKYVIHQLFDDKGKRVILLVDDFDAPWRLRMESASDESCRNKFFRCLFGLCIASHVVKVLFVGTVLPLIELETVPDTDNIFPMDSLRYKDCFGFTKKEAARLVGPCSMSGIRVGDAKMMSPKRVLGIPGSSLADVVGEDEILIACFAKSVAMLLLRRPIRILPLEGIMNASKSEEWFRDQALEYFALMGFLAYRRHTQVMFDGVGRRYGNVWISCDDLFREWQNALIGISGFSSIEELMQFFNPLIDMLGTTETPEIITKISTLMDSLAVRVKRRTILYDLFTAGLILTLKKSSDHSLDVKHEFLSRAWFLRISRMNQSMILVFRDTVAPWAAVTGYVTAELLTEHNHTVTHSVECLLCPDTPAVEKLENMCGH